MVFHSQVPARYTCRLLAIPSGSVPEDKSKKDNPEDQQRYPFPQLNSSGRLEVQVLSNPSKDQFCRTLESYKPNIVYLQGEQLENDEVGSLVWGGVDLSTVEAISGLFNYPLLTTVYLDIAKGDEVADALHSKGIPYVIYWRSTFTCYTACHFRNAFLSVLQSSSAHTWDAFQLAHASFRMYCLGNNFVLPSSSHKEVSEDLGPHLLGERLKINVEPLEKEVADDEESSSEGISVSVLDNDVEMRFLVCGEPGSLDAYVLEALEDGLNALLDIEVTVNCINSSDVHSAPPPPLQAGTLSNGVVTMRCDLSTCSFAHISLLVSGSAQACFDDQLFENYIKNEIIDRGELVQTLIDGEGSKHLSEPRKSTSIACGATVFEVSLKVPSWASQILRQLAPDVSYRSLVGLGIASIQGLSVASFEKDDAERLLFFCSRKEKDLFLSNLTDSTLPSWLKPPAPRKRSKYMKDTSLGSHDIIEHLKVLPGSRIHSANMEIGSRNGFSTPMFPLPRRRGMKIAAMRPIPHVNRHKMISFHGISEMGGHNGGLLKASVPSSNPTKHVTVGSASVFQQKVFPSASQYKQIIPMNPLPLKKHGCGRSHIQACFEEEFLKDLLQFLALRGHSRLIPPGGLAEFPDAILNGKRLDLYNLYKEVVSRGGFRVGNGINWKGQIFSKMRNYTMTNRMTGVGNTLKRHYETYLLEYELAHEDVDGECCLLCHSSAAGDWVNCGFCGEWAHFGCDRRQGLGAFKDYAKTDGLEYICPHCSVANYKKKKVANGLSPGFSSRPM
ncbi:AT-rich interactive domain-containing protein 4-like [Cucumis melo var. makuwa]|uniref:AT-rich interactive domain-containing protein 4-like n=1 Tax=Cucumis melo var. makuwa TaxID=1194695 RepID=A0A5A7V0V7_CUCMM|nr:AT-rich interactive domain-containing protein 4-like [Cucumis melo var. makuwa]